MHPARLYFVVSALLGSASMAHATDWIVDDGGGAGVDFTTIQAAVDASQPGDHVRVRTGTYPGFTVDGKWLVVAEEPGGDVRVTGRVVVRNVPADRGVQILGLHVQPTAALTGSVVEVGPSVGPVILARCLVKGWDGGFPSHGLQATNVASLLLQECILEGGRATNQNTPSQGGRGVFAIASRTEFHGSTVIGGRGGSSFDGTDGDDEYQGESGGAGAWLEGGSALAIRSSFQGGAGGNSSSGLFAMYCAGSGHDGVAIFGCVFEHVLTTATGGMRGFDMGGPLTCDGQDGLPYDPPTEALPTDRNPICFGLYGACPCDNEGHGGAGCENSFARGARLDAIGAASISQDGLTLAVAGVGPTAPVLFFQGTSLQSAGAGAVFGDGLRCAGGTSIRLGSRTASAGAAQFGFATGDPSIALRGQVSVPGTTRVYQVWYRNSAPYCTASTSNLSNGYEVRWDA